MSWKITALNFGICHTMKGWFTPGYDDDLSDPGPYLGWLLQDGRQNVLVDAGVNDRYIVNGHTKWHNAEATGGVQLVVDELARHGLAPEDVDMVIYTHLHNDHVGACHLFKHALNVFQKKEWENLLDPLPNQLFRGDFDMSVIDTFREMPHKLVVDGDTELGNGLKLYLTPGHTKGSQSIWVPTENGPRIIVGDLFYGPYYMWPQTEEVVGLDGKTHRITPLPKEWGPILVHMMIYDAYAYYDSYYKILGLLPEPDGKYVLYGHYPGHLFDPELQ